MFLTPRPVFTRRYRDLAGVFYSEGVHQFSKADRVKMIAWALALRAGLVAAVIIVALLPSVSTLMALLIVSAVLFLKTAVQIMFPAVRRERPTSRRPRGGLAGDRFPRRPLPWRPSGSVKRPLPPS